MHRVSPQSPSSYAFQGLYHSLVSCIREAGDMSAGDAGAASRKRPLLAFPDQLAIAVLRHPMR